MDLSIVIPIYNENDNIRLLYESIVKVQWPVGYEIVFVNDGSQDKSLTTLRDLAALDDRVRIQNHERNSGQCVATWSGIISARGEYIGFLDGDLQNPPEELNKILAHSLENKLNAVFGYRALRRDRLGRRVFSYLGNTFFHFFFGSRIIDHGCSVRVIKKDLLLKVGYFSKLNLYLGVALGFMGHNVVQLPVRHEARRHGQSKYGWSRVLDLVEDSLILLSLRVRLKRQSKPKSNRAVGVNLGDF